MAGSKKSSKGQSKGGKNKKDGKKSSRPSTKKGAVEDETNTKTGEARFKFLNRDIYEGQFKVTKVPTNYICRKGTGTYKTADGQTYTGQWDEDILKGEVEIRYKDGGKYTGPIEDMKYTGYGRYEFPDTSATTCNFILDRPVGEMVLTDPSGHEWRGLAGSAGATFFPLNRFLPLEASPLLSSSPQISKVSINGSHHQRNASKTSRETIDGRSSASSKQNIGQLGTTPTLESGPKGHNKTKMERGRGSRKQVQYR